LVVFFFGRFSSQSEHVPFRDGLQALELKISFWEKKIQILRFAVTEFTG